MKIKHILATFALALTCGLTAHGGLTIDGHLAVLDSLTNTYLCPIKRTTFGTRLDAVITFDSIVADTVLIDGWKVANGGEFAFFNISGNKRWTIKEPQGDSTVTRTIAFTYLPIMVMNGTFGMDYTEGTIQLLDPDNYTDEVMLTRVKWRGGTTNLGDKHKRNYHLKFVDENGEKMDRKFLGLRKDNSWIMDAGQVDFFRMRNRVATELWNDFASKPYHAQQEPKVKTGVDGGMIEVFLNGKYVGLYALTEAMDRKLLKLKKYDENTGEIHGQLWKTTGLSGSTTFNIFTPYDNTQEEWNYVETKYPELDEVFPTDYSAVGEGVHFGDTAKVADFNLKAHTYYDMPVMIDYEILLQTLLAIDNYAKNIYWYTYDTPQSPMLSLGVWDLDTSMGGNWETSSFHPTTVSPTRNVNFGHAVFGRLTRPTYIYRQQSIDRYHELRKGVLNTDSLIARYTDAFWNIYNCGAVDREEARWSHDSDLSGRELNIYRELNYITNWIKTRMDFLDNTHYHVAVDGDANADYIVDVVDINDIISSIISNQSVWDNVGADVNHDGKIDVVDINYIINLILN